MPVNIRKKSTKGCTAQPPSFAAHMARGTGGNVNSNRKMYIPELYFGTYTI